MRTIEAREVEKPKLSPWILALIIAVSVAISTETELVGRLFGSELIILAAIPFLLWARGRELLTSLPLAIFALGLGWFASQVLSDIVLGSELVDFARGWAKIVVFLVNLAFLYLVLGKSLIYWKIFAVGLLVGQVLDVFISPTALEIQNPWKFGYGFYLTLMAVLTAQFLYQRGRFTMAVFALLAMSAVNVLMTSRAVALLCLLTAVVVVSHRLAIWYSEKRGAGQTRPSILIPLILTVVALVSALQVYGFMANNGFLGDRAKSKFEDQTGGQLGIILGGRKEILVSSVAILDSPLVGHGSWADDPRYSRLLVERATELGYTYPANKTWTTIPSHSYLFGAWVNAGIMGAVFWAWMLVFTIVVMATLYRFSHPQLLLVSFVSASLVWDILFSPFGGEDRLIAAFAIVLIIGAWKTVEPDDGGSRAGKALAHS